MYADRAASEAVFLQIAENQLARGASPGPNYVPPRQPESIAEWLEEVPEQQPPNYQEQIEEGLRFDRALEDANDYGWRIDMSHTLGSHDLAAHIIFLTTLVEVVVNRQLFFLGETGRIVPEMRAGIDRGEVIPKIIFCFKEEILSGNLTISRIKRLVTLRNKAVHYREDSTASIRMTVEELIATWREIAKLLALCPGEPTPEQMEYAIARFRAKWF
jgi:hypothetical protein